MTHMIEPTLPHKCETCPVRAQGAPFCWKDLKVSLACLGQCSQTRQVGRSENLYRQGDRVTGWWVVRRGRILEYIVDAAGREEIIVRLVTAGSIAGICGLGPWNEHWASGRGGRSGAEVCFIPQDQGHRIIAENPDLSYSFLAGMAEEVRLAYQRLHGIAALPARACAAGVLLAAMEATPDGRFIVDLTRREIANMVGVTLETAVRTVVGFREQGLIRNVGRGRIEILDACRLHALSQSLGDASKPDHRTG